MSSTRVELDPQRVADGQAVPFDCSSKLQVGQTVASAVMNVSVWSGNDPTPASLLTGAVTISGNIALKSKAINQGVAGTIYLIQCVFTLTGGVGTTVVLEGLLAILPEGI